jgi:exopolyphosphatase/guanosine-5'-triphosphate,3'-diphosphate pyrophosphatase
MPGMLPRVPMRCTHGQLELDLPKELAALSSERLFNRLKQLARIIGRSPVISCSL